MKDGTRMNAQDYALYQQAEALANSGQTRAAHQLFCALRDGGNTEVEIFFWIATTAAHSAEARQAIDMVRQIQPYHPRLPALVAFHARRQRNAIRTRIFNSLYLCAVAFIIIYDIPRARVSTLNTIAIISVVLWNIVLLVNIIRLVIRQRVFTTFSALYISALMGFILPPFVGDATLPLHRILFGVSVLYIGVYTVVLAVRSIVTGKLQQQ
jgi:hypothetical protein